MRPFKAFLLFLVCLAFGYWLTLRSWNGYVYVYTGEHRAPANAGRSLSDYTALDRSVLTREVHQQLVGNAKLSRSEGFLGVRLGHPLLWRVGGGRDFACTVEGRQGVFDKIELSFWGIGVTQSGRSAEMTVQSSCQAGETADQLAVVWIPMRAIVSSEARDQELQIFGDQAVLVRLKNIPDEWPESWVLTGIRLFRESNPDDNLEISASQIKEAHSKIITFDWKTGGR